MNLPRIFAVPSVQCGIGKSSDMPQEMVQEAVEIVTMSVDKFINVKNYEVCHFFFCLSVLHRRV